MPTEHSSIDECNITLGNHGICHPSAMIRKISLEDVGGYNEDQSVYRAEDIDLWLRIAEKGMLANLGSIEMKYRQHPASVGHDGRHLQLCAASKAIQNASERRGLAIPAHDIEFRNVEIADVFSKWGWWALGAGNVQTARKYAVKAILAMPYRVSHWRLLACALRGY